MPQKREFHFVVWMCSYRFEYRGMLARILWAGECCSAGWTCFAYSALHDHLSHSRDVNHSQPFVLW